MESGLYAWRASTNPDDLWLGSSSPCLAPGTLMSVGPSGAQGPSGKGTPVVLWQRYPLGFLYRYCWW